MLEINQISKYYQNRAILDEITMTLRPGTIYSLAGASNAGKTAFLEVLSGLAPVHSGTITLQGIRVAPGASKAISRIGYLPEHYQFYPQMTVSEYLECFCRLYHLYGLKARIRCERLLEQLQLSEFADRLVETLSASQQQSIQLIRATLHDPHLLLFDCPHSSADANTRLLMQDFLTELARQGKIVLITTRSLSGSTSFADEIGYLHNGRLLYSGSSAELSDAIHAILPLHVQVRENSEAAYQVLSTHPYVRRVTRDRLSFQIELITDRAPVSRVSGGREPFAPPRELTVSQAEQLLLRDLVAHNLAVTAFYREKADLDQLFAKLSEVDANEPKGGTFYAP